MECGCILQKKDTIFRWKKTPSGLGKSRSCPVHTSVLVVRRSICECGEVISQRSNRSQISKQCQECTKKLNKNNQKKYSKARYRKKQVTKRLIVNDNGIKPVTKYSRKNKKLITTAPIEEPKPIVFKKPKNVIQGAKSYTEAMKLNIPCIPLPKLFRFHRDGTGGQT